MSMHGGPAPSSRPIRRVLFLAAKLQQVGGIADYNTRLVEALRSNGIEVELVERHPGGTSAKAIFLGKILLEAVKTRPDFILCTHLNFAPAARFLRKILGIPFGIVVYGVEIPNAQMSTFRKCLEDASLVVHLFDHAIDRLEVWIPGIRSKAYSLLSAVDGERFRVLPKAPDLVQKMGLEGRKVLLTLCRMSKADGENKGYRRVLEALPRVLPHVDDLTYILAGGGDDLEDVRRLVEELGLSSTVILPGHLPAERVVDYYNLADLFVLPSKEEGFPAIVLLEALACGVPVMGGNQPGAEAALLDGELGCIVPHDDVEQIAAALVQAMQAPPPAWRNRERLRERALERYGIQRYSREVSGLVDRIAQVIAN
jgi:glycosyltransferase involved in cell wall biosynthesis